MDKSTADRPGDGPLMGVVDGDNFPWGLGLTEQTNETPSIGLCLTNGSSMDDCLLLAFCNVRVEVGISPHVF